MSAEKPPLPTMEVAKTDQRPLQWQGKKFMLLVSYGVGVTVLLAACLVFGSILYHIQFKNCTSAVDSHRSDDARGLDSETTAATGNIKEVNTHYKTPNGDTVNGRVNDDYTSKVETIYFTSDGPENGTILALDYRRSMSSLYIPSRDHCYIIGGIHRNFTSPFESSNNSLEVSRGDEETKDGLNYTDRFYYLVANDYPVRDHSILPATMRTYCRDREVFWLERISEADEPVRRKRRECPFSSICRCGTCCPRIPFWRCCWCIDVGNCFILREI